MAGAVRIRDEHELTALIGEPVAPWLATAAAGFFLPILGIGLATAIENLFLQLPGIFTRPGRDLEGADRGADRPPECRPLSLAGKRSRNRRPRGLGAADDERGGGDAQGGSAAALGGGGAEGGLTCEHCHRMHEGDPKGMLPPEMRGPGTA